MLKSLIISATLMVVAPQATLATGDAVAGKAKAAMCAGCHSASKKDFVLTSYPVK